jgi:hypothetical protein
MRRFIPILKEMFGSDDEALLEEALRLFLERDPQRPADSISEEEIREFFGRFADKGELSLWMLDQNPEEDPRNP